MPSEWEGLVWMKQRGRNSARVASARVTLQGANLSVSSSDLSLTGGKSEFWPTPVAWVEAGAPRVLG